MRLTRFKKIHFTGIKGVGMTALALCAKDLKIKISGSDLKEAFPTDKILKKKGIRVKTGFKAKNVPKNTDLLIYTGAHGGATNVEVVAAKQKNRPTLSHAEALKLFCQDKKLIATAGVGGKSTTAALIATVLTEGGLDPSFAVGVGDIPALGAPGRFNQASAYFVAEADEYVTDPNSDPTPRFHHLDPFIAVITNLEHDHPDVYPHLSDMFDAFATFVKAVPAAGLIVANVDNPRVAAWLKDIDGPKATYGFSPQADWQVTKVHLADQKQFFTLAHKGAVWPDFVLNLPGRYNVLNAAAAVVVAHHLGVKLNAGVKKFSGTKRRFEFIGRAKRDILLYDDYAHHPTEIKALLRSAKDWFPGRRLIAVFQSHTFSRTKALLTDFAKSFQLADLVIINKIFASARETDDLGISGKILAQEVLKNHPQTFYCPGQKSTIRTLIDKAETGDIIFTIGAGDIFHWHKPILKALNHA